MDYCGMSPPACAVAEEDLPTNVTPLRSGRRRPSKARTNRRGETWDETQTRVNSEFPATRDSSWVFAMSEEALFAMVGDLIKKPNAEGRSTCRELPELEEGRRLLRCFFDKTHTTLPFVESFGLLCGSMTRVKLGRFVGLRPDRVGRLLNGRCRPTRRDMEVIAAAFGKDPRYFVEYRSMLIAGAVHYLMECDPDRSAVLAQVISS